MFYVNKYIKFIEKELFTQYKTIGGNNAYNRETGSGKSDKETSR